MYASGIDCIFKRRFRDHERGISSLKAHISSFFMDVHLQLHAVGKFTVV
jgi:hypothetical protein